MCKIVFAITFNVNFGCSKEPSHMKTLLSTKYFSEKNMIVDLRIISKLKSKLNIKMRASVGPPGKRNLNGILWTGRCRSDIVCWLGLLVMTCKTKRKKERKKERKKDR